VVNSWYLRTGSNQYDFFGPIVLKGRGFSRAVRGAKEIRALAPASSGDFMGGFNIKEMMSMAKQQAEALQKKMEETTVEATAGGGSVSVKMNGHKQILSLKIDPEAVKGGDVEMLQDLVTAAVNEGCRRVDEAMQSSLGGMLGGLGLG
jgi:nucleoid-associated protein EbfC